MKRILLPLILLTIDCVAQTPVPATGNAKTAATCSAANTGNQNHFIINCGIGKEQGQQMIAILNKVLANQLDPTAVMAKLDEILKNINPNRPVKTYRCSGQWSSLGPGQNSVIEYGGGGDGLDFDAMINLANSGLNSQLVNKCEALLQTKPEWLSPLLFCSVGYFRLGNIAKAKQALERYDSQSGPAYDEPHCQAIASDMRAKLQLRP